MTQALIPPKTRAQRLRSFDPGDFPLLTGREEEWRFTPLARLRGLHTEKTAFLGSVITQVTSPPGVAVECVDRTDSRLGQVLVPFDRISASAWAAFQKATIVTVPQAATLTEPIVIDTRGQGTESVSRQLLIRVDPQAQAVVVLRHEGSVTLADNVEVSVGDGARLTLVTVADWAPDGVHAQHLAFRLGRDAKVSHVQVALGGDLVRQYTTVDYAGRGGECEAYGVYFANPGQHLEHRLLVDHSVPDCRSFVSYRGALQGEAAHTVWVGDVLIRAEATGTDTYEINRNLVLTEGARADSVPNLEIETGDVAGAGHASATGRFDDEQLFYLMSRGIPAAEARRLVVRGFFAELLDKIPLITLRDDLTQRIEARLAEVGQ